MNRQSYESRLRLQFKKLEVEFTETELTELTDKYHGFIAPSTVAVQVKRKATSRTDAKSLASERFSKILNECCDSFGIEAKQIFDEDMKQARIVKVMASYIALETEKIRPASAISEILKLPSPASVYHLVYGARKLVKAGDLLFIEKLNEITENLIDAE